MSSAAFTRSHQGDQPALSAGPVRRAELLAALSLAADLGMGQPLENALRTAILAVQLGRAASLGADDLKDVYYVGILKYVGCTADAHVSADVFGGDEIAVRGWLATVDWGKPAEFMGRLLRDLGAGEPPLRRARILANAFIKMPRLMGSAAAHCEVAQALADDFDCSGTVRVALGHAFERWDGKGIPHKRKKDAVVLSARVVQIADDAQVFHREGGTEAVVAMLRQRAAGAHDPTLSELFCRCAPELLASLEGPSVWDAAMAAEPGQPDLVPPERIETALRAMGAFADLKSTYTRGHSAGVAALAAGAAVRMGLPPATVTDIRYAGYLHDIGRAGVSAGLWEKAGALSDGEWERVRLHAYFTERILARPALLGRLGGLAALDHERLDGSGYHRRLPIAALSEGARVLAAGDVYHAMGEDRPHRKALTADAAAAALLAEAAAGRLDRDAVHAVLETAGHAPRRPRAEYPGGLSDREVEVLRLVASGLTNKEVAVELDISTRTVGHHLQHVYEKIGVTTRAAAAMFAMRHGLIATGEPRS